MAKGVRHDTKTGATGDGIVVGSEESGGNLWLRSTDHATKGSVGPENGTTFKPESTSAFILPQTGTGVPSHTAPEGQMYWATDNHDLYINTDSGTTWEMIAKDSVVRYVSLGIGDFQPLIGSPALTPYLTAAATGSGFLAWALDGATDEAITATFKVPYDFVTGHFLSAQIVWLLAVAAGASQDIRMGPTITYISPADTLAGTGNNTVQELITSSVASGAQYKVYSETYPTIQPVNDADSGDMVEFTILRRGGQAADDYNSDIGIIGARLTYLADWAP